MSLRKKILKGSILLLLTISFFIIVIRVYFSSIENLTSKPYELSHLELKSLSDKIETLNSIDKRIEFLESIFSVDQEVRRDESNVVKNYGYGTSEHAEALSAMDSIDTKNLYLMKKYLDKYGFPEKPVYSDIATFTPLLVFHHKSNLEEFKQYFQYFYLAYTNGDISANRLNFSLSRKYMIKFNKNFGEGDKPYNDEEKIKKLIKILELD